MDVTTDYQHRACNTNSIFLKCNVHDINMTMVSNRKCYGKQTGNGVATLNLMAQDCLPPEGRVEHECSATSKQASGWRRNNHAVTGHLGGQVRSRQVAADLVAEQALTSLPLMESDRNFQVNRWKEIVGLYHLNSYVT
jgi:hypothetical protein